MARRKSPRKGTKDNQTSGSSDTETNAVENIDAVEVVSDVVENTDDATTDVTPDTPADAPVAEDAPTETDETDDTAQDETPQSDDVTSDGSPPEEPVSDEPVADDIAEGDVTPESDVLKDTPDQSPEDQTDSASEPEPEPEPEPENDVRSERAPVQPEPERASILPMILAGILTAILGFMAARSDILPASLSAPAPEPDPAIAQGLADTTDRLAALEATVAALPEPQAPVAPGDVDLGPITEQMAALSEQIDALTAQVDALAARPEGGEIVVPDAALDAALAELRDVATRQQDEIDALLNDARTSRNDTTAEANATLARAAMARVLAAIETGAPYAAALSDLEQAGETDIAPGLQAPAAEGVVPLATLQNTVADAARDALAAARESAAVSSGLGGFLQRQLGTRSVEPREGTDPDAVLSRIEATVRAGNIGDALTEAELLPDPARDAMGTWLEQAQTRYDAVTAAHALAERLSAL